MARRFRPWFFLPLALGAALLQLSATGPGSDDRELGVGIPGGPLRPLSGEELRSFLHGREVFNRDFDRTTGLGTPELNADSCRACHQDPVLGGAGGLELNVSRFAQDHDGNGPFTDLEGGQVASKLRPPWFEGRESYDDVNADVFEQRQTPTLLGAGLIDSIYESSILAHADPDDLDADGIRGTPRWISVLDSERRVEIDERGLERLRVDRRGGTHLELGRFGWKAQIPTLVDFMRDAMAGENGVTTPPDGRGFGLVADADGVTDPELSHQDLTDLSFFVALLAPPARAKRTPEVARGELLFEAVGCNLCHVPALEGSQGDVQLYSDLLLHHVMPTDFRGMQEPGAPAGWFRTPPLWGLRDTGPYLHDGRAETVRAAIELHDGEGRNTRLKFENLGPGGQDALLAFLLSL